MFRHFLPLLFLFFPPLLSAQDDIRFRTDAETAQQLIEQNRFLEAKQITDRLLRQAASHSNGYYLYDLAMTLEDYHRYADAEPLYKRALEIYEAKLDWNHPDVATLRNELGAFYGKQGRYNDAEPHLIRALEIRGIQLGPKHPDTVQSMNDLALHFKNLGRYREAEPYYTRALKIIREDGQWNDFREAVVLNNLGVFYQEQYRNDDAEKCFKDSLAIGEKINGTKSLDIVPALFNLARLYREMKRYDEAESLQRRALAIDESDDPDSPGTAMSLDGLATIYYAQGQYAKAEPLYKRSLDICKRKLGENHPQTADTTDGLAITYAKQGRFAEAEPLYDRAVAAFNPAMEARLGQIWYRDRADLYKATERPEKAVADLKQAMELSLQVRKHASGSDEQRAETFARYYGLFETMVAWQHELGDMNEAYEAMERSRAQGLQDIINSHGINLLSGVAEETAKKLRADESAALAEVASCEKQLEVLPQRTDLTAAQKKAEETKLTEALKVARKKLVDAMAAIRSASPAYRLMIAADRKPVALASVRKDLAADKAVALQYLIGREKAYVLVYGVDVEPTLLPLALDEKQAELFGVEAGALTAKNIETIMQNEQNDGVLQAIADRRRILENGLPDAATAEKLHVLWSVLIPDEAVRKRIVGGTLDHLLVLPDGALAKLPFEALIVSPDPVSPQYLLDRGPAVVYSPSASMYYNLKRRNVTTKAKAALTVGDPFYDAKTPASDDSTLRELSDSRHAARFRTLKRLPHTASETSWIAESCKENGFAVTRLDRRESTEANVRKNIAGRRLVHLACHGFAEDEYGNMFGGLALTVGDPSDPRDDGFLELAEMFSLDLKGCELAILSACETNLGPNQHGEGTWSMSRGMLASGSRRVVTTNWQVADDASARLIYFFVDAVNTSGDFGNVAQSLCKAKRDMRSGQNNPAWRHPYYWAPFVLVGGK